MLPELFFGGGAAFQELKFRALTMCIGVSVCVCVVSEIVSACSLKEHHEVKSQTLKG